MTSSILHIKLEENLFLKDPTISKLGKLILSEGLLLLNEIGLEEFTQVIEYIHISKDKVLTHELLYLVRM